MVCQNCQKREASVLFAQIENGKRSGMYLCTECAKEKEQVNIFSTFSISDFYSGFMGEPDLKQYESDTVPKKVVCDKCGMSYEEFQRVGRLGCYNCYDVFSEKLKPLLKRLHGNLEYKGKFPAKISKSIIDSKEIENLKEQLNKAIQIEEYEKAAEFRDKIRLFEEKNKKSRPIK